VGAGDAVASRGALGSGIAASSGAGDGTGGTFAARVGLAAAGVSITDWAGEGEVSLGGLCLAGVEVLLFTNVAFIQDKRVFF
jgi:hypothetical protein